MRPTRFTALMALTCCSGTAFAVDVTPNASVITTYTDNALGTNQKISETAVEALVGLRINHDGPRLTANGNLAMGYREYLDTNAPSETLPAGTINIEAALIPERLTWELDDRFGQISTQSFEALRATDRQDVNTFTTGPTGNLFLTDRTVLRGSALYGNSNFSSSDIDSQRYTGEASLIRLLSETNRLSLTYRHEEIDYKLDTIYPKIQNDAAFLAFGAQTMRTSVNLEAGIDSLKVEGLDERHAPHFLAGLQRRVSPRVTLNFEYQHSFSDASDSVRSDLNNQFQAGNDHNVQPVAQPFVIDEAYAMLVRQGNRLGTALQYTWRKENYNLPGDALNRTVRGLDLIASYALSPVWTLEGQGRWVNEKREVPASDQRFWRLSAGLSRRLSRSLQMALVVERSRGTGEVTAQNVGATAAALTITWAPGAPQLAIFNSSNDYRFFERGSTATRPGSTTGPGLPTPTQYPR